MYKIKSKPFFLTGPCVIESEDMILNIAEKIKEISLKLDADFVFKSSFKKANRTSVNSFTGPGLEEGLRILQKVKDEFDLPVVTDIHEANEAAAVGEVVDILQVPAFLCRQTDLLVAAGKTGKWVNVKKGQFLNPKDMKFAAEKIKSTGNDNVLLCERGTTFGYGDLVVDMRGLQIMKKLGYPVVMDLTHAVQKPGAGGVTGGAPEFIPTLAKATAAVGVDGFFIETHPDPAHAKSDASSQLPLDELASVLQMIVDIRKFVAEKGYDNA